MIQLRTINKALKAKGFGEYELVKGEGYFWIYGPNTEAWYTASIYVYALNQMTLEQWLEAIIDLIERETK